MATVSLKTKRSRSCALLIGALVLAVGFDVAVAQEDKGASPKPKPALPISAEAPGEQLVAAITKALEERTINKGVTTPEQLRALFPGGDLGPVAGTDYQKYQMVIFPGTAWTKPPQAEPPYNPFVPRWRLIADFAGTPATLVRFSLQFLQDKTDLMPGERFCVPR